LQSPVPPDTELPASSGPVALHLDPARRGALYGRLATLRAQVWMSGADPAVFEPIASSAAWFDVTPRHEAVCAF
jgi:recombinational DNA repair ATPase RecF